MQVKTDSNRPVVLLMSRTSHNEVLSLVLVQNGYDGNLQQLNNDTGSLKVIITGISWPDRNLKSTLKGKIDSVIFNELQYVLFSFIYWAYEASKTSFYLVF